MGGKWTAGVPLPGGDFPVDGVDALTGKLQAEYDFLDKNWAQRLVRTYGTLAWDMLGNARAAVDLGTHFGATLHGREIDWAIDNEWVRSADDLLWRRTKLGLTLTSVEVAKIEAHILNTLEYPAIRTNALESKGSSDRV